jgi:predicted DsbA family dithiol-disulfide isomerase
LYDIKSVKTQKILTLANEIGMDYKKLWYDSLSKETEAILEDDIKYCNKVGVNATPTMLVNGEKIVGIKTPKDLVEILEKHGAKKIR